MTAEISYSYVALLDVLAYREYLARDRASGGLTFRTAMQKALSVLTTVNQVDFGYTAISDTIIVTCAQQDRAIAFFRLLKRIQIAFLKQGLFLRGAAAYAQHFQSGNLTYSPALARAYELEQSSAIYPRILIDRNILDMFKTSREATDLLAPKLITEWNGVLFLNVLDERNWKSIYASAKAMYEKDAEKLQGNESAFSKHVWFENLLFASPHAPKKTRRFIPSPELL